LLSARTDIPVQVTADATMPVAMFVPIGMGQVAEAPTATTTPDPLATATAFTPPTDRYRNSNAYNAQVATNVLERERPEQRKTDIEYQRHRWFGGPSLKPRGDCAVQIRAGPDESGPQSEFDRVVSRTTAP
jgi:hypothetical protein